MAAKGSKRAGKYRKSDLTSEPFIIRINSKDVCKSACNSDENKKRVFKSKIKSHLSGDGKSDEGHRNRSAPYVEYVLNSKERMENAQEHDSVFDDSESLDEETLKMLEPVVNCDVSEGILSISGKPENKFEPVVKCEVSDDILSFDEKGNIITQTVKCQLCRATFNKKKNLKFHMLKHTQGDKIQCNICGKIFANNRFLKHVMVHTGEKPHPCEVCGRCFRLKRDLKQHSFTHTGERPYPCKMCGKKFADASARRKHYQTHTGEKPYSCEVCQRAFTQISHLREHQVTHTGEKVHICDLCEKSFTTKSSLHRHVQTHTNSCEICGETFKTSVKLDRHKEMHDITRPYSCPYCTKRFQKKTDVNTHLLIHSDVKDVICKICNGAFKSYRYLRVHHYHYHQGMPPPFICPNCKKGFFQESALKKHSFAHIPKSQFKCHECKKTFSLSVSLEDHICLGNDAYFYCEFCEKKYRHKSDLNKHVRKFHD